MEILITLTSILVLIMILKNWSVILITIGIMVFLYLIFKAIERISIIIKIRIQKKKDEKFKEKYNKWKNIKSREEV